MVHRTPREIAKEIFAASLRTRRRLSAWSWRVIPGRWRRPFEVVTSYDAWRYLTDLTDQVSSVLDSHRIEHLVLAERLLAQPIVAIRAGQARRVRKLLAEDPRARYWWLAASRGGLIGRAAPARRRVRNLMGSTGLLVSRNLVSEGGLPLTHSELGVLLEFWTELSVPAPSPGGGELPAGTLVAPKPNGILDYAGPASWRTAQEQGHRRRSTAPHLLVVNEPVDLVYTWVDGHDPAWRARKAVALGTDPDPEYSNDAAIDARFESRDELRYSLRSVQMFASWVRHIWIVTDRQAPAWLLPDERLTVVDHREIFADPNALPVFNSHAIESQLHHIPGLSDLYLYLNDDMMFGAPVLPENFFHANGITKFFTSLALIDIGDLNPDDLAVTAAAKNNRALIEAEFDRTIANKLWHTPQAQSRRMLAEFERSHPELFDQVMRSKFRHSSNHSLPSSLSQYYAFATQQAVTGRIAYGYLNLSSARPDVTMELWLQRRNQQCLCINDAGEDDAPARQRKNAALRDFFEAYYPLPSRWERS